MTPNLAVAVLQLGVFLTVLSYFIPRTFMLLTKFRHNRDGLLSDRLQSTLKSLAVMLAAVWGFYNRLDMILHPDPKDRWLGPPGDRWEDVGIWILMLLAVAGGAWLYHRDRQRHKVEKEAQGIQR